MLNVPGPIYGCKLLLGKEKQYTASHKAMMSKAAEARERTFVGHALWIAACSPILGSTCALSA